MTSAEQCEKVPVEASRSGPALAAGVTPNAAYRTHPANVTADRLVDQVTKWAKKFDGYEKDAVGVVINVLREIAEGNR